ncbi:hypothetical protein PV783_13100 [Chitinophaga sp. CC14]|uniref:hypothetical protein n=1 Tax=Chitinophaga sp. CC14 TaxID=3029199 RepID=UPI003B7E2CD9
MILPQKYRSWIASILLALYAFIAMPVHYWHSHPETIKTAATSFDPGIAKACKYIPAGCKVCDHQYTVYYNQQDMYAGPVLTPATHRYAFPAVATCEIPSFACSNKGPPAAP